MLSQNALTVFLKASDDVTECLALSVFKCPHLCLIGLMNFKISWYLVFGIPPPPPIDFNDSMHSTGI